MSLSIRIFGAFLLAIDKQPTPFVRSSREQWLLAYLILHSERSIDRDALATLFFPDSPEQWRRQNLRRILTQVRSLLGPEAARLIAPTVNTVRFVVDDADIDVLTFDRLVRRTDSASLEAAVKLYTGPLLESCPEEWILPEREARKQSYLQVLERLAAIAAKDARYNDATRFLKTLLAQEPTRESTVGSLMEILAAQGNTATIAAVWRDFRLVLHKEWNTEPGAAITALYNRLRNQTSRPKVVATSSLPETLHRLPVPLTALVGRKQEVQSVKLLLKAARLVSLLGMGGIGKTRLAIRAAEECGEDFPDGRYFIALAPLSDPDQIVLAAMRTLGLQEEANHPTLETLCNFLRERQVLLVLDNCEHLIEGATSFADSILSSCPQVRILSTSRESLRLAGEQIFRVPTLPVPDGEKAIREKTDAAVFMEYGAVRLFVERARAVSSIFRLTSMNVDAVATICARLDGLPLALELAAARISTLTAEQIASRLNDRFALLTGGSRTALPRQRTLQAAFDWSYDLLTEPERVLLTCLSVFAGGWTLEAAEAIASDRLPCSDILDLLTSLVDKSLVLAAEVDGAMRYRMLETIRQYGHERLIEGGDRQIVRVRYRDYFLTLAEEIHPKLHGHEQVYWLSVLEREHDNFLAALAFSENEDASRGLRLCVALHPFWQIRGYLSEGIERLMALLSYPEAQIHSKVRADALHGVGTLTMMQGNYSTARSLYEESLLLYRSLGDRDGIAATLRNLGDTFRELGNYSTARSLYTESLALYRESIDKSGIAFCLVSLGVAASEQGDYSSARSLYEESLALRRELGDQNGIAYCLSSLGVIARMQGDYSIARQFYHDSLAIYRELGNKSGIASLLNNLGNVARDQGDFPSAHALYAESVALRREVGDRNGVAVTLNQQGNAARDQGAHSTARLRYGESLTIFQELGDRAGVAYALNCQGLIASDQRDYVSARSFFEEGLRMFEELGDKNGISGSLIDLGDVACEEGDYTSARSCYKASLTLQRELKDKKRIVSLLKVLASLALKEGQYERSLRLWGAVVAFIKALGSTPSSLHSTTQENALSVLRASLSVNVFTAAWEGGSAMTWEQAIDHALEE